MESSPKSQVASMLRNAMLNLKQRNGVRLTQIQKHLEASYSTKLDMTNKKRLASAMKDLVRTGTVEKTPAGLYKLKSAAGDDDDKAELSRRPRCFPRGYCKTHTRYHKRHSSCRRRKRHNRRHAKRGGRRRHRRRRR